MPENRLVTSQNHFAFKLFGELAQREDSRNLFISPTGVALALAMLYAGARGATRRAMAAVLGLGEMASGELDRAAAELLHALCRADPQVTLAIASSLWAKQGTSFKSEFLDTARQVYDAQLRQIDFASATAAPTINAWVSKHTGGKIDRIVDQISPTTVLVLINAIYFKGSWTRKFDQRLTREGPFTLPDGRQKRPLMMSQSGKYRYLEGPGFQSVSLPYGAGHLSMYIFLPDTRSGLNRLRRTLEAGNWDSWMARFHEMEGDVALPRFKIEYDVSLNDALKSYGMAVAFGPRADFTGLCDDRVQVDEVRHKTFVEVNEEGTEAAAATSATMVLTSFAPKRRFSMVVDRPFFCAIRDNLTGAILFMGTIVEPE